MATSGGEREERQAWTHDKTPPSRNGFQTFPQNRNPKVREGVGKDGGPGPCKGRGPGDGGR